MVPTNSHTTRCRDNPFYRNLTFLLVMIFVFLMVVISIAWLVMHPHDPDFRVTSLSVTNFALSESQVRGRYVVGLTITNRNKIKTQVVLHRFSCLGLHSHEEWLLVAVERQRQQRVFLEKFTNKSVNVDFEVRDQQKKVVPPVLLEDLNKGVMNFNVILKVTVRFEAGIWPSKDKMLDVCCKDLNVEFHSDTGKFLGMKNCYTKNTEGRQGFVNSKI